MPRPLEHHALLQTNFLTKFTCLGAECEDTCCRGWGMQLDTGTREKYQKEAPELLDAVTTGEAEWIMKRDPETDYCVKFTNGLCGIQKERGSGFLGDACHFYPRITRTLGDASIMTAALSCPEIVRLVLEEEDPFALVPAATDRLPYSLKTYGEASLSPADMQELVQLFIRMALDEAYTPERSLARIFTLSRALEAHSPQQWPALIGQYSPLLDILLPPVTSHFADNYRLVNMLVALEHAAPKSNRQRLYDTISSMETALGIRINRTSMQIEDVASGSFSRHAALEAQWQKQAQQVMAPVLRRWIAAQLSMACFPFAGLGDTLAQRCTLLAVRFATTRLALMSHMDGNGAVPDSATTVRIIQSLSRFLDHLADPTLSLQGYEEAGWADPSRMRGLIGDKEDA